VSVTQISAVPSNTTLLFRAENNHDPAFPIKLQKIKVKNGRNVCMYEVYCVYKVIYGALKYLREFVGFIFV
jgi:uncharacterized membrane protein